MKTIITREDAQKAVELYTPIIKNILPQGTIIIMDPDKWVSNFSFEEAILYLHHVGDDEIQLFPFNSIATEAAHYTWSRGESVNWGEWGLRKKEPVAAMSVSPFDIIIAVSGNDPAYDVMLIVGIAHACYAIAQKRVAEKTMQTIGL